MARVAAIAFAFAILVIIVFILAGQGPFRGDMVPSLVYSETTLTSTLPALLEKSAQQVTTSGFPGISTASVPASISALPEIFITISSTISASSRHSFGAFAAQSTPETNLETSQRASTSMLMDGLATTARTSTSIISQTLAPTLLTSTSSKHVATLATESESAEASASEIDLRIGDKVPAHSAKCGRNKQKYLPQSRCCDGKGCCPGGVTVVEAGGRRPWNDSTDLLIVMPEMRNLEDARVGGSREAMRQGYRWVKQQTRFPYVLCPFCSIQLDAVCPIPTHQGFEASAFLSFIVHNYDRLPRAVAFLHGHAHVQAFNQCTNLERLLKLAPYIDEDMFVYIGGGQSQTQPGKLQVERWRTAGQDAAEINKTYWFMQGPHFVAGRNRIRSRSLEQWKDMLAFAVGQKDYPDSESWSDKKGNSHAPGHLAAGAWQIEVWWNMLMNPEQAHEDFDADPNSIRCKMKWCKLEKSPKC
eukprot:TRINITY_DN44105_c0_g1_i1.p1 TRINITY_DN44105_c0_g1~~TRINITY_DN44105_c0_g1_i1.p1  ORF type:complete len:473 (+),score=48.65 TRINITY_DN44105_c0_g1_i1:75-1493(+)